jgi:hypothetical protein
LGQAERSEMVDREAQLVAIGGELARRAVRLAATDPGVVDQDRDVIGHISDRVGKGVDLGDLGEVGLDGEHLGRSCSEFLAQA